MMTNARVSPTTIRVFTPATATPRQSAPMMFSDWNLLWSLDIALPRVHVAFIKREMLIRSEEKTILRYRAPKAHQIRPIWRYGTIPPDPKDIASGLVSPIHSGVVVAVGQRPVSRVVAWINRERSKAAGNPAAANTEAK
jgi:hypothetical protein